MKNRLLLLLIVLLPKLLCGQSDDTLTCGYDHSFTWQQAVTPAALIATGTAISFSPHHSGFDMDIRDWSQRDGHQRFEIEDYIQYAPCASVVLLKAAGIESRHQWRDIVCLEGGSALIALILNNGMKHTLRVERPYGGVFNSFPSGHTTTAFLGAEMLRREYGDEYPAIAVAGYTVATGVGLMRIYNNRHWASDVLAGAGIGILSASLMYWLAPYLRF